MSFLFVTSVLFILPQDVFLFCCEANPFSFLISYRGFAPDPPFRGVNQRGCQVRILCLTNKPKVYKPDIPLGMFDNVWQKGLTKTETNLLPNILSGC